VQRNIPVNGLLSAIRALALYSVVTAYQFLVKCPICATEWTCALSVSEIKLPANATTHAQAATGQSG
jgi:hypothetical protein